jgi:5-methylcytosine-specific restriction endonuclease McrA
MDPYRKDHEGTCPECGRHFVGRADKVYCSKICQNKRNLRIQKERYRADAEYRMQIFRANHESRGIGDLPSEDRLEEMRASAISSGFCPYCGEATADDDWRMDHIVPVSRGGTNLSSNLLFVCSRCNCRKGAKPLDEFLVYALPHTLEDR